MAPIEKASIDEIEEEIKDTIQSLYQMMIQVTNYDTIPGVPRTRDVLAREMTMLSRSLQNVHAVALRGLAPGQGIGQVAARGAAGLPSVPQELVQYVEAGRNPDIYTREFVELVRRGNQLMRGKQRAFAGLRDTLAEQMRVAMPELAEDVDRVIANTGGPVLFPDTNQQQQQQSDAAVGMKTEGGAGTGTETTQASGQNQQQQQP